MKSSPKLCSWLYKDKSFTNPVLSNPNIATTVVHIDSKYDKEDFTKENSKIVWYDKCNIYDVMRQNKDFMYISSGLTASRYDLINVDIDYDDYNDKFIEAVKKTEPSAIIQRKSNKHLQIQYQLTEKMWHSMNKLHKIWQEHLNELVWRIAYNCGIYWNKSELDKNNSTTAQNVYHTDFRQLYCKPENKSVDWKYIDDNGCSQIRFLYHQDIQALADDVCGLLPTSSYSSNNSYVYPINPCYIGYGTTTKSENHLKEGSNNKRLVEGVRNKIWQWMRKNNGAAPTLSLCEQFGYDVAAKDFVDSHTDDKEIRRVVKSVRNWSVTHYNGNGKSSQYTNSELSIIKKQAQAFIKYVDIVYNGNKENYAKSTVSRFVNLSKEDITKYTKSAYDFLHIFKYDKLINDVRNSYDILLSYNFFIDSNNDNRTDNLSINPCYIGYGTDIQDEDKIDKTDEMEQLPRLKAAQWITTDDRKYEIYTDFDVAKLTDEQYYKVEAYCKENGLYRKSKTYYVA